MKCNCGFNDGLPGTHKRSEFKEIDGYPVRIWKKYLAGSEKVPVDITVYICPKCGTLKVDETEL